MAVIDLRQDLTSTFANLGKGLGMLAKETVPQVKRYAENKENRAKTREFYNSPEGMQQMARALRVPGADAQKYRDMGFTDKDIAGVLQMFPETLAEQYERRGMQLGLGKRQAEGQQVILDAEVGEAGNRVRSARAAAAAGLPEATVGHEIFKMSVERAQGNATIQAANLNMDQMARFGRFVNTLSESEQNIAAAVAVNPNYFNDIRERTRINLQERGLRLQERGLELEEERLALSRKAAQAAATNDQLEYIAATFALKENMIEEMNKITERLTGGEDVLPGEKKMLLERFNSISDDYYSVFSDDPIPIMDATERLFGGDVKDVSIRQIAPRSMLHRQLAMQFLGGGVEGDFSFDDYMNDPEVNDADKNAVAEFMNVGSRRGSPTERLLQRLSGPGLRSIGSANLLGGTGPSVVMPSR